MDDGVVEESPAERAEATRKLQQWLQHPFIQVGLSRYEVLQWLAYRRTREDAPACHNAIATAPIVASTPLPSSRSSVHGSTLSTTHESSTHPHPLPLPLTTLHLSSIPSVLARFWSVYETLISRGLLPSAPPKLEDWLSPLLMSPAHILWSDEKMLESQQKMIEMLQLAATNSHTSQMSVNEPSRHSKSGFFSLWRS